MAYLSTENENFSSDVWFEDLDIWYGITTLVILLRPNDGKIVMSVTR